MTDEEMAYKYAKYEDNGVVSVNDDKFKAFLAGLEAGKPYWHDLRKDANDLPKEAKDYLIYTKVFGVEIRNYHTDTKGFCGIPNDMAIAWCELPIYMDERK